MNEPAPLPDDLLDYLAAAREPEPATAETKARMLARLGPFLPPGGGGPADGGGGAPGDGGTSGIGSSGTGGAAAATGSAGATASGTAVTAAVVGQSKWVVATIAAVLGAGGGAALHATVSPPVTVVVQAPVVVSAPNAIAEPLATIDAAPVATAAHSASPAAPPDAPPVGDSGPRKSSLRAERILLEAANAAILRGEPAAAIATLQQHARTYPRGELAQERDVLMAQAKRLQSTKSGASAAPNQVSSPR